MTSSQFHYHSFRNFIYNQLMTGSLIHINELSVYPDNHIMNNSNAIIRQSIHKPSTHNNIQYTRHKSQILQEKYVIEIHPYFCRCTKQYNAIHLSGLHASNLPLLTGYSLVLHLNLIKVNSSQTSNYP